MNDLVRAHGSLSQKWHMALDTTKARVRRFRIYRDTLAELTSLSDRELSDLGLSRTMLRGIARDAAREA